MNLSMSLHHGAISLTLPINATAGMKDAYFDEIELAWKSNGLKTDTTSTGALRCQTNHLTLFAGIVASFADTIMCVPPVLSGARRTT